MHSHVVAVFEEGHRYWMNLILIFCDSWTILCATRKVRGRTSCLAGQYHVLQCFFLSSILLIKKANRISMLNLWPIVCPKKVQDALAWVSTSTAISAYQRGHNWLDVQASFFFFFIYIISNMYKRTLKRFILKCHSFFTVLVQSLRCFVSVHARLTCLAETGLLVLWWFISP